MIMSDLDHRESLLEEQLPLGFHLLPGEKLVSVVTPPLRSFTRPPSSLQEVLRLTRATSMNDIGKYGPSVASLAMEGGQVAASGHLRLYEVLFGRDSLRVAMSLIDVAPQLARTTVLELARNQGTTHHKQREEEPGRIVHEVRDPHDPIAVALAEQRGWGWPYYGTVDATPEFIRTMAAYIKQTGDKAFMFEEYTDRDGKIRTIAHALELALQWIENRLGANEEGLLEYRSFIPLGIENQVWKDSWDSYSHHDGTVANYKGGIASIEVQGAVYDAFIDAAELLEQVMEMPGRALHLRLRAEWLKDTVMKEFWTEDKGGYFVIGTDRDETGKIRQINVRASNMGHLLNTRLLDSTDSETVRRKEAVIRQLLSPEMLAAAGVRTLASDEVRYREGSYHNGSVWLWDSHLVATGLRRHGYDDEADMLDQKILDVIDATHMLPEYVRGCSDEIRVNTKVISTFDETYQMPNTVEQLPQEVQAWTAAAVLEIKTRLSRESRLKTRITIAPKRRDEIAA